MEALLAQGIYNSFRSLIGSSPALQHKSNLRIQGLKINNEKKKKLSRDLKTKQRYIVITGDADATTLVQTGKRRRRKRGKSRKGKRRGKRGKKKKEGWGGGRRKEERKRERRKEKKRNRKEGKKSKEENKSKREKKIP